MGEIADMMLDGTLCEGCGVYLGAGWGPTYCPTCAKDHSFQGGWIDPMHGVKKPDVPKLACPTCGKFVKITGIGDHWRQVHGVKP
jgi:uncharacterized Zn finger protein (UPF0148 family)